MDLGLRGKFAIVNGASQGIGYAIARTLAGEGAAVLMSARRGPVLQAAGKRLEEETGIRPVLVEADLRSKDDCDKIVRCAKDGFGRLDILVNNDGAPPLGAALEFDDAAWHKAVDQNLMSVVRMCRGAVPLMTAGGGIVNIAALSTLQPLPGFALSVATWAGVIALAKTLSIEHGPKNINVNTLCPGLIETPRLQKVIDQSGGPMMDLTTEIPMGRYGKADEVADLVAFLVSPRGRYISGTTINIDGGLRKSLL
jgi:3-oxoacyl-[acyl-carrier protein] reductase